MQKLFARHELQILKLSSQFFVYGLNHSVEAQKSVDVCSGHHFVSALKACAHAEDVAQGKHLHSNIIRCYLELDSYVGNTLMYMYAKCGCLEDARSVLDHMQIKDLVSWNTIISGFAEHGKGQSSLQFFYWMQKVGMLPNRITYICVLKACSSICALDEGMLVHAYIVDSSMEAHVLIGNSLIDMYAKCRSLNDAEAVLGTMLERDIVAWSTLMSGFCEQGYGEEAVLLFVKMQDKGLIPTRATYLCALKACSLTGSLPEGMLLHAQIIENAYDLDVSIGNMLIDMYAKCASSDDACEVFKKSPRRDVVTWTSLVANLASCSMEKEAIRVFDKMQFEGVKPNQVTYLAVLKACSELKALDYGRLVHAHVAEHAFESTLVLGNTLLDMYAKCGSLYEARRLFDALPSRDVISWSAMITGYTNHDRHEEAFQLFKDMHAAGIQPTPITYVGILKLGSSSGNLIQAYFMHSHIIKYGFDFNLCVGNSLVNIYFKCRDVDCARKTFDVLPCQDVVTWSAMITGYAQGDHCEEAFHVYSDMKQAGEKPNEITFVAVLKACVTPNGLDQGRCVHQDIINYGYESNVCVGNAITHMYTLFGFLEDAKLVLDSLRKRDVVTWTVMIAAYAQQGQFEAAHLLFQKMQQEGVEPNNATFISIFKSCSTPASIVLGNMIHAHIVERFLNMDSSIANSLIHMYSKCESLADAIATFGRLSCRDIITWSTFIAALSEHGLADDAFRCFSEMQQHSFEPNRVTLLSILKACSSIGHLEEGHIIHAQVCENGLDLDASIGNTLIDMYAKCGALISARNIFDRMLWRGVVTWTALIDGHVQQGCSQEALNYFGQMLRAGIIPNEITLLSVLGACSNIAAVEQGKIIHALVIEMGLNFNINMTGAILDMYNKCASCLDAEVVFDTSPIQDTVAWSSMVDGYAQVNNYNMALHYLRLMQKKRLKPDDVTLLSLLSACNHAGLTDEGLHLLALLVDYGVQLSVDHYNCIMDLLGRAGRLEEAQLMSETLPLDFGAVSLTSLLGHSKTHGEMNVGTSCFGSMLDMDKGNASPCMLVSTTCAYTGGDEVEDVEGMRKHANA